MLMKLGEIIAEQHEYFNKVLGKKKSIIAQVYNNCSEKNTRGINSILVIKKNA